MRRDLRNPGRGGDRIVWRMARILVAGILLTASQEGRGTFALSQRQWQMEAVARAAYLEGQMSISYWLAMGGVLLVGLLTVGLLLKMRSNQKALEQLVAKRTAELVQAQEMFRLVLDAIPVRVHWKDRNSVYLGCNRRFAKDAELNSPGEIAGKTDFDLPWKQYAELYRGRDRQVIESGQPMLDYEQPRCSSDGRMLVLRQSKLPLRDAKGEIIGVLSTYEDVTERKQAEEALRKSREQLRERAEELETIMGSAPVALWVAHDPQCNYISGNRMASSFDEGNPQANWSANVSSAVRWFRGGRQLNPEELPMQQAALKNTELQNTELELLLQSGRRVNLLGSATPLRDTQGRVRGCVGAFLDITALKQAESALRRAHDELALANAGLELKVRERTAELLRAKERLEELDRLKSQFLATMSHELRTPLNSIIGFTGILQKGFAGPVNDEQKKQLGLVFGSAKHLLSLINDLLDLSRIEAGKVEIEQQPFNYVEVIEEVVQNLTPLAGQKRLKLAADVPGPMIEMVGDRKRCFQVLLNLANNAVKFTDRGEVKIKARIEGEKLRVCVADTGIGIKPEQLGMLFEAFRQLDGTAKRVYEGTGLGLHLCRKLLTLMRGEIGVESEFGKGSRFTFVLPRQLSGQPAPRERRI